MQDDPIVQETRQVREEIVDECGQDVHTFFEYLRERERLRSHSPDIAAPSLPSS